MKAFVTSVLALVSLATFAQEEGRSLADVQKTIDSTLASKWYERIQLRGYAQMRYNRLGETNKDLRCSGCDKSIGENQGFFLRRGRLVLFGEVAPRVFVYIQPDYASDSAGTQNYFQIRDAYFDYALTEDKVWRIRSGLSKIPYGFENLQSSSNRASLDRADSLNSAVPNERDIGMFLMYTPSEVRQRFKDLTSNNLKGSGDYGMIAIGGFNGQTLNKPEQNNDLHRVVRVTYPFKLQGGQFMEASLQAYEGKYVVSNRNVLGADLYEQRTAGSFIFYPQPFGFQVEYNEGVGPEYDPSSNTVKSSRLKGGYAQINYQLSLAEQRFFPYLKYQEYQGGRKVEDNAKTYRMNEWEVGTEWQFSPAVELTAAYAIVDRATQSSLTDRAREKGSLIRLQAQFNY